MTTANNGAKAKLLSLLERAQTQQRDALAIFGTEDAAAPTTGGGDAWTVKDHMGHLNFWRTQTLLRLAAAADGTTPPDTSDIDALNAQAYLDRRDHTWADVHAESERLFTAAREHLARLSDDDLSDPNRYPWRNGQPLTVTVMGNFFSHPAEHYSQLFFERGDGERAIAQQQLVVDAIRDVFGPSPEYGNMLYNLGCLYARNDKPTEALDALREAFVHSPGLAEFAPKDSDLTSLHSRPEFQALLTQ